MTYLAQRLPQQLISNALSSPYPIGDDNYDDDDDSSVVVVVIVVVARYATVVLKKV